MTANPMTANPMTANPAAPRDRVHRDPLAESRFRRGQAALADGALAEAAEMTEQALALAPDWVGAWATLGAILRASGDEAGAAAAIARALALDPADRHGAALARDASVATSNAPADAPPAYVAALFDAYAAHFDTHLTHALRYDGPAALLAALREAGHIRFGRTLDLGCGTGLCGAALRPAASHLAGVDLSPGMIAVARGKRVGGAPLYDRLEIGALQAFLDGEAAGSADTIVAGDVFAYLGDLRPVLAGVARVLEPGGALAFTVQTGGGTSDDTDDETGTGYHVGVDMRFRHSPSFVTGALAATGLRTRVCARRSVRRERDAPVPGLVVVAGKP